ncbi:hypothetical protein GS634_07805 [Ruegeria atlantica]|uniref:Uncharacterized protein n=1 Tax=Ruegeria atlantica TaxID=81569 RepID=A0AA91BTC7_9RHOB|nr:hypothetical protein [Ruegeria atlantica]NOE18028.1 hypothetical protein [Ruegeria atlantica]
MNTHTKRLAITNLIYKVFTPDEFLGLPKWAKDSVTNAAERDYARSCGKSVAQPKRRKSRAQIIAKAKRITAEVEKKRNAKAQHEAEQRAYERTPHAYWGSRY